MIRFTSSKDGFFEAPSGGAERVEAGARFVNRIMYLREQLKTF